MGDRFAAFNTSGCDISTLLGIPYSLCPWFDDFFVVTMLPHSRTSLLNRTLTRWQEWCCYLIRSDCLWLSRHFLPSVKTWPSLLRGKQGLQDTRDILLCSRKAVDVFLHGRVVSVGLRCARGPRGISWHLIYIQSTCVNLWWKEMRSLKNCCLLSRINYELWY